VSPSVEQVVLDLLAKDPSARPPDAHAARQRLPEPQAGNDAAILDPEADPVHESTLSATQWLGLATAVVLVLAGTYAGVRATLGLPILSVSAPTPPDAVGSSTDALPAPQREPVAPDSEEAAPGAAQTPVADASSPSEEIAPIESDDAPDAENQTADESSSSESSPSDASPSSEGPPSSDDVPRTDAAAETPAPETETPVPETESPASKTGTSPSPGVLTVRSAPAGANVQVDDSVVGRAPVTVDDVAPGQHRVALRLDGHRPVDTTVDVPAGDTAGVVPSLPARPAVVRLRGQPTGTVRIDGTRRAADSSGTVIDSLSPGPHRIALTSDLGRWETQVRLAPGDRYERTVDFARRVEVAITARTADGRPLPNAAVRVDGDTMGYTPQRLTRRVGQHTITVAKDGYVSTERTIRFGPDMDTPIVFELSPQAQ
jgi:hypothetical protein